MNTEELSEHLHHATETLEPPPGFADTVLRGGRRRRGRRRTVVAASVVAVAAVATSATVVALRDVPQQVQTADVRLTQPTRGDLAGDQAFLDQALNIWRRDLTYANEASFGYYDDRRGEPRVLWAGSTPAGRAAVVVQQIYVHERTQAQPKDRGLQVAEGLVAIDPADGKLKLVDTASIGRQESIGADYYKFGPGDRTLLIVDYGKPLHYSFTVVREGETSIRTWQQAQPRDGAALVHVPEGNDPAATAVYQGDNPPRVMSPDMVVIGQDDPLPSAPGVTPRSTASDYLANRLTDPDYRRPEVKLLKWGNSTWEFGNPPRMYDVERDSIWGLHLSAPDWSQQSEWDVTAALPDGRLVILKETQAADSDTPRLTVMVSSDYNSTEVDMVDGGPVDAESVLPVRFRIPDGGGWIVADKGKALSYRTSSGGEWQDAGRDAALLPDNATEVKVDGQVVTL